MNSIINVISVIFVTLVVAISVPNIKDYNEIRVSGEEIIEIPSKDTENKDCININDFYRIDTEEYATRGEDADLVAEYDFFNKIAEKNDLEISRQRRIYISEFDGQKAVEYSKFQENCINYHFKDNKAHYIEIKFSENEILDKWEENSDRTFLISNIENETVHIFEWAIPNDDHQSDCRAQFRINGMNFVIKIVNASHEESIKIIKTTIKEYKNFEKEKNEAGYIKIREADLYSEGSSLIELIKYDDKLYGKSFSEIDYVGNPNGPIGVIDKLVSREYIPIYNGETNSAKFLNSRVDYASERRLILLADEGAVAFERIYIKGSE